MARRKDPKSGLEFVRKRLPNGKHVTAPLDENGEALMPATHPGAYSKERGEQVIELYREGNRMSQIALLPGMPNVKTIYRWMEGQPDFRFRMKEARKLRGMYFEEKAFEHAEDATEFDVQSRRLKVETMKWAAEVNDRETYGKSTKLLGDPNQPIAFIIDTGIHRPELDVQPTDAISLPNLKGPAPTEGGQ